LTRTSKVDDVAPDVSVYPDAPGIETDHRQLEELAFEVVSTQSLGNVAYKAAKLAGRGVRRVFAIDVERSRALEWSQELETWRELDPSGEIDEPALEVPLPIAELIGVSAIRTSMVEPSTYASRNIDGRLRIGPEPRTATIAGLRTCFVDRMDEVLLERRVASEVHEDHD
jgi:hypothetical protein